MCLPWILLRVQGWAQTVCLESATAWNLDLVSSDGYFGDGVRPVLAGVFHWYSFAESVGYGQLRQMIMFRTLLWSFYPKSGGFVNLSPV